MQLFQCLKKEQWLQLDWNASKILTYPNKNAMLHFMAITLKAIGVGVLPLLLPKVLFFRENRRKRVGSGYKINFFYRWCTFHSMGDQLGNWAHHFIVSLINDLTERKKSTYIFATIWKFFLFAWVLSRQLAFDKWLFWCLCFFFQHGIE